MKLKCKSGIYKITNNINKKVYIGSSKNVSKRIVTHKNDLKNNKHCNFHLQSAWNKYHSQNFDFQAIEYCEEQYLVLREEFWINHYESTNNEKGYNIDSFLKGRKNHSIETKLKISSSHKGKKRKPFSLETRLKISNFQKGRIHTKEHNKKVALSKMGKERLMSENWKNRMVEGRRKLFFDIWLNNEKIKSKLKVGEVADYLGVTKRSIYLASEIGFRIKDHIVLRTNNN